MPRNTTGKSKGAWPNVLRFVASLLFLYVIFTGASMTPPFGNAWLGQAGSLWLPILFGVAVLGSIALFFSSLAGIAWGKDSGMTAKILMWSSITLVALTASPAWGMYFWVTILGFIIGWLGSALEMM